MGFKININKIILEIEYMLIISLIISSISNSVMNYLSKYYICLLFVIYHELAHVLVGTLFNKKLKKIFVGISGMTAYFKYEYNNKNRIDYLKDSLIFLAGPISNIIIAIIFKKINIIFEINLFLAILNLLPIYPLDGFNIVKCLLRGICIKNKDNINIVIQYISICFLIGLSCVCIYVFFFFKNISSIVFLLYLLLINIKMA